jgi:NNP family nitrate/nitrite transporter-like MFS transporter
MLAFLAGLGGGNFSSFMPSTSLFFPKRLQGTALGIQAGVGNFGVSLVQFLVPWIIGLVFLETLVGQPQTSTITAKDTLEVHTREIQLQNAAYVWIPFILVGSLAAWLALRDVPVRASLAQQTDIFKEKHNWVMTSLYLMTFGSFSGLSATFPVLIQTLYSFKTFGAAAPDPLTYAFLGPLVGSVARILSGPISDRLGGARVTQISGIGLFGCAIGITWFTDPISLDSFPWFVAFMLGLFLFSGIGNASTFKQIPVIFPPRQAGGVIGWTAAAAAYGPLLFSGLFILFAPTTVFYGIAAFYAGNIGLNWWYYARKGAEKPC